MVMVVKHDTMPNPSHCARAVGAMSKNCATHLFYKCTYPPSAKAKQSIHIAPVLSPLFKVQKSGEPQQHCSYSGQQTPCSCSYDGYLRPTGNHNSNVLMEDRFKVIGSGDDSMRPC